MLSPFARMVARLVLFAVSASLLGACSFGKKTVIDIIVDQSASNFIEVSNECKVQEFLAYCVVKNRTDIEFELYYQGFMYRATDRKGDPIAQENMIGLLGAESAIRHQFQINHHMESPIDYVRIEIFRRK